MNKFNKVLILILVILIAGAVYLTFMVDTGSFNWDDKGNVSMVVTGDVMIGKTVSPSLDGVNSPFEDVLDILGSCDILLINFENAATSSSTPYKSDIPLKVDPSYVSKIKVNNRMVAALANNHIFDYGVDGMHDTLSALQENGIIPIGAGDNADAASKPVTLEIEGRKITILNFMDSDNFAAYSQEEMPIAGASAPGYSAYDSEVAQKLINESKAKGSDFVVVFFHFGNEYSTSPNEVQVKMAHEVIDYGADAVVGSHPHVAQGIETYSGKPIFYSLGDFVFYPLGDSNTNYAYFVKFDLHGGNCTATVYPVTISNNFPHYMDADSAVSFLKSLYPSSESLKINNDGTGTLTFELTAPKK